MLDLQAPSRSKLLNLQTSSTNAPKTTLLASQAQINSKEWIEFPSLGIEVIRDAKRYRLSSVYKVQTLKIRVFLYNAYLSSRGLPTRRVGSKSCVLINALYSTSWSSSTRRVPV